MSVAAIGDLIIPSPGITSILDEKNEGRDANILRSLACSFPRSSVCPISNVSYPRVLGGLDVGNRATENQA